MTAHLSPEEIAEFREIFNLVDKDGGGSISKEELAELMDTLGIEITTEELDAMVREIDASGDGNIDFEEFVEVMSKKVSATYTSEQVKHAFHAFEEGDQPGFDRAETIVRALCTYGTEKMTQEQALDLVSQLEVDPNGLVNYEEYVNIMMSS